MDDDEAFAAEARKQRKAASGRSLGVVGHLVSRGRKHDGSTCPLGIQAARVLASASHFCNVACTPLRDQRLRQAQLKRDAHRLEFRSQETCDGVGTTGRSKGTKWTVVVDGKGVPLRSQLVSASSAGAKLVGSTLAVILIQDDVLQRRTLDRGYGSNHPRVFCWERGFEKIDPHCRDRKRMVL